MHTPGHSGSSAASSAAMGMAAVAYASARDAEKKAKKIGTMGKDQILIKTKTSKAKALERINKLDEAWLIKDGEIYEKGYDNILNAPAIVTGIVGGVVSWGASAILEVNIWPMIGITTAIMIATGYLSQGDNPVEYISVEEEKYGSSILLEIYDDEGDRNLDERDLGNITELFEGDLL